MLLWRQQHTKIMNEAAPAAITAARTITPIATACR
jgi:hypothetical protein